jgi:hypothetical protein
VTFVVWLLDLDSLVKIGLTPLAVSGSWSWIGPEPWVTPRWFRATNDVVRLRYDLGVLSTGRRAFYERLGWERWQGQTYVQIGSRLERTPDEDAGIMVLRTPRSPSIDLRSDIGCQAREGDDW